MAVLEDIQQICLVEDTEIKTPNGVFTLKELPNPQPFSLWSFNFQKNKIEIDKAIKTFSGRKKVYKITTQSGKEIEATEEHKFFIENDGKIQETKLKYIKIGDRLVII